MYDHTAATAVISATVLIIVLREGGTVDEAEATWHKMKSLQVATTPGQLYSQVTESLQRVREERARWDEAARAIGQ